MIVDLASLSPAALAAAMRGGTEDWGQWGGADHHILYVEEARGITRRLCRCGCRKRITYRMASNGVTLAMGCEMHVRRIMRQQGGPRP